MTLSQTIMTFFRPDVVSLANSPFLSNFIKALDSDTSNVFDQIHLSSCANPNFSLLSNKQNTSLPSRATPIVLQNDHFVNFFVVFHSLLMTLSQSYQALKAY